MKRSTLFALPLALIAVAVAVAAAPQGESPQLPSGSVGRYQLTAKTGPNALGGVLYRIDTTTGQTWQLIDDTSPARWTAIQ